MTQRIPTDFFVLFVAGHGVSYLVGIGRIVVDSVSI